MRRIGRAAALLGFALLGAAQAQAASSELCRQLEVDLASASRDTQLTSEARRYDRAIESQERQLAIAEGQWQRAGCGYRPRDGMSSLCLSIEDTLARMDDNYTQLRQERARMGVQGDVRATRLRIQREMQDAGCNESAPPQQEAGLPPASQPAQPGERLRTMCVRTCDGYFFPLSYGVTRDEFDRDARACKATCPSTEMKLFYHKVPSEEATAMVSADTGQPYASMPMANLFRKQNTAQPNGCGCAPGVQQGTIASAPADQSTPENMPGNSPSIEVLPDQGGSSQNAATPPAAGTSPSVIEQPKAEPQPAKIAEKPPEPGPARAMSDQERKVRVVGPTFLPAQEGAIDLRAPGRTTAP